MFGSWFPPTPTEIERQKAIRDMFYYLSSIAIRPREVEAIALIFGAVRTVSPIPSGRRIGPLIAQRIGPPLDTLACEVRQVLILWFAT